jgi:hypothetical protein
MAACAAPAAPSAPPKGAPTAPIASGAAPATVATPIGATISPPESDPFAKLPPSLRIPSSADAKTFAVIPRSGTTWPFHTWDHAEVFAFNWMPYGEKTSERIYDESRWSPNIKYRAAVGTEQAELARHLVEEGRGEILRTKCPNPHHAVVFYDRDVPVGSVSVSFECPDVLLWPHWPSKPNAQFDSMERWSRFFFKTDMVRLPETPPELLMH